MIGTLTPSRALGLAFVANPASVHVRRWTGFFAERGHDVTVIDGFGGTADPALDHRIRLIRYESRARHTTLPLASTLTARRSIRRALVELSPDIVHAHTARRYAWHAALAGHHPYVVSVWGSDVLLPHPNWRSRLLTRVALRSADLVTAVTPAMAAAAVENGARRERTALVHHGVDIGRFRPGTVDAADRQRLVGTSEPYMLSPRALRPLYNHLTGLEAFARATSTHRLVLSSAGEDPDYRRQVVTRASELGIADRVVIVGSPSDDDLAALYRGAEAVISVATSDSFSVTLLEAMASGVPVVAGDVPPIRAVLGTLAPEHLAPPTDPDLVAAALRRAIRPLDSEGQDLRDSLRRYVVEHADYRTNMLRMEQLYYRLVPAR